MLNPNQITPPAHTGGITFECEDFPVNFSPIQEFGWSSIHYVKPGSQQHSISMVRDTHTLLIFDRGSYSDGWRSVDGLRIGQRGILGTGVDVVPAGSQLNAWSGLKSNIGCTLISVDPQRLDPILGEDERAYQFRPASNLCNELLVAVASRISAWVALDQRERGGLQTETLLTLLAQELSRVQHGSGTGSVHRGGLAPRVERQVREFVNESLSASINLETLASLAGLSRFHFSRAFKASFGLSPHKYVQQERLRRACELMEHSDQSITDIALQVGFASSSELARTFKQLKGFSPRQFRNALSSRTAQDLP
ncbi:helix-turn-helix domain-containing protein [Comamonas fluminis]|uniref:helix-turn-helix domain-containing protein n=1 Tax=Comamonas fluminis TaxID=2796366 RepID=UPI001C43CAC9|nr:AraC family transcriptional regulator [Comamonas fluminis]